MKFKQLILVTGIERSGSTLISRVLQMCEAKAGHTNKMRENVFLRILSAMTIADLSVYCKFPTDAAVRENITDWDEKVTRALIPDNENATLHPFIYKDAQITQLWKLWAETYQEAKWIIVRRKTDDILNSVRETSYMTKFKNPTCVKKVGALNETEAWLWWITQHELRFEEMLASDINCRVVWPEKMRDGDFSQIKEVVRWCGLEWNRDVEVIMTNLLNK